MLSVANSHLSRHLLLCHILIMHSKFVDLHDCSTLKMCNLSHGINNNISNNNNNNNKHPY